MKNPAHLFVCVFYSQANGKNGNSVDFCRFYVYTFPYILIRKELPWTIAKISKKKKSPAGKRNQTGSQIL